MLIDLQKSLLLQAEAATPPGDIQQHQFLLLLRLVIWVIMVM
jgi:hypothetical protein